MHMRSNMSSGGWAARSHPLVRDNDEIAELLGIAVEHCGQAGEPRGDQRVLQTEVDDAGVRLAVAKHELAEIAVVRDQNPAFRVGDGEHLVVGQTGAR